MPCSDWACIFRHWSLTRFSKHISDRTRPTSHTIFQSEVSMTTPTLSPHLVVNDGEAAIAFYENAFGATLEAKMPAEDGKRLMHVHLKLGAGALFLHDDF